MDKKLYEKELKEKQEQHLQNIQKKWRPCFHDACTECHGTGITEYGTDCIHGISCPCPKCTLSF